MGWWGHGIMDGDTPLDCRAEVCEILGVDQDYYEDMTENERRLAIRNRYNLVSVRKKLLTAVNKNAKITWDRNATESRVFCQVAATMVMDIGHLPGEIDPSITEKIVRAGEAACQREREFCNDDGWNDHNARYRALTELIALCAHFVGDPTEAEMEYQQDNVITVTFSVHKCHKVNRQLTKLHNELKRVQEGSEVGLMLEDIEVDGISI